MTPLGTLRSAYPGTIRGVFQTTFPGSVNALLVGWGREDASVHDLVAFWLAASAGMFVLV